MKGVKKRQAILLEQEPAIPDETEVSVVLPGDWEARRRSFLSVGVHPDFGKDIEQVRAQRKPQTF
ncbi:MAG: hypothetical protein ACUVXJ_15720 [Phycisphaerae bacterium]